MIGIEHPESGIGQSMSVHQARSIITIVKLKCRNGKNLENGLRKREIGSDLGTEIEIENLIGAVAVLVDRVTVSTIFHIYLKELQVVSP